MAPSSRFAESLNPNVAYRDLNLSALVSKQTTLPSLDTAGQYGWGEARRLHPQDDSDGFDLHN
jgi:hypothetical protein